MEPLRIKDLIEHLQFQLEKEGNLVIAKVGHFGEIHELNSYHIGVQKARHGTWGEDKEEMVLAIDTPDIGPEPD